MLPNTLNLWIHSCPYKEYLKFKSPRALLMGVCHNALAIKHRLLDPGGCQSQGFRQGIWRTAWVAVSFRDPQNFHDLPTPFPQASAITSRHTAMDTQVQTSRQHREIILSADTCYLYPLYEGMLINRHISCILLWQVLSCIWGGVFLTQIIFADS